MKKYYLLLLFFISLFGYSQTDPHNVVDGAVPIKINVPTAITFTVNQPPQNTTRNGLFDGSINVIFSGGSGSYTYLWTKNNADISTNPPSWTGLGAGSYTLQAKDNKGCLSTVYTFEIKEPDPLQLTSASPLLIKCFGEKINLTAQATGGYPYSASTITRSYYYTWYSCLQDGTTISQLTSPSLSPILSNQPNGYYKVTVYDGKNTSLPVIVFVDTNSKIEATPTVTNAICKDTNGSISLEITGGKNPYTVNWKNASGTSVSSTIVKIDETKSVSTITAPAGDYTYTVNDNEGCVVNSTKNWTIGGPVTKFTAALVSKKDPSPTINNGSITLNVGGGYGNYTYTWTKDEANFAPTNPAAPTGLPNGKYSVTVTDKKAVSDVQGCPILIENINLESLSATISITTPINCIGDTTTLEAIPEGGSKSYSYEWFKGTDTTPIGTEKKLPNSSAGTYKLIVTDINSNYTYTSTIALNDPVNPPIAVSTLTNTPVHCYGGNDGTIYIQVKDGNPVGGVYTFTWAQPVNAVNTNNSSTVTNLAAGSYDVKIQDQYCTKVVTIIVEQPLAPITIADPVIEPVLINGKSTGSIKFTADATGGTSGYEYKWIFPSDPSFPRMTKDISGLKAGTYTLEIRDVNFKNTANNTGCMITKTYVVTQSHLLKVDIKKTQFITCKGKFDGELEAEVSGGIPPYKYVWEVNGNLSDKKVSKFSNAGAGSYNVYVTDSANLNGPYAETKQENFLLEDPDELLVSLKEKTDVKCYDNETGAIQIDVKGGTKPYTYQWTFNGQDYATSKDLSGIKAGIYNVVVTDAVGHNCKAYLDQPVEITQPKFPLKLESSNPKNLTGFETENGSISVVISGGTPAYTYEWTLENSSAIFPSNPEIKNLIAGTYHLNVKDANNCNLPQVDFVITQPDKLIMTSITQKQNTNIACFGDASAEFTAVVEGGVKEYKFIWLNESTGVKYTSTEIIEAKKTISTASGLPAGKYLISVEDKEKNKLYGVNEFTILQPGKLTFTHAESHVSCHNGSNGTITLNITGGTKSTDIKKPYTIVSSAGMVDSENGIISGLMEGNYTISIIDANGCQTPPQIVSISQPSKAVFISDQSIITPTTGFGLSTGKIEINAGGGTPGYSYQWKNSLGNSVGTNNPTLSNVPAGTYTLLVTDVNNCTANGSYVVPQPTKPILTESHVQSKCNGLFGSLEAISTGGATYTQNQSDRIYVYKLKNKNTGSVISITQNIAKFENIPDGDYSLIATDVAGIDSNTIDVIFKQPTPIVVNLTSKTNVSCHGGNDGVIAISVTGGTPFLINNAPVYNYQWKKKNLVSNNYENFTPTALNALTEGIYAVEVTDANYNSNDANHCIGILDNIVITQPADFGFDIDKITYANPTSQNGNDGSLHFEIIGGKTNYEYKISTKDKAGNETVLQTISNTSAKMVDFNGLIKDHYYVSVQDDTGCTKYTDFDFTDNPLTMTISQTQEMTCFEANNAAIKAIVAGGFGIKKITWYRNAVLLPNENNPQLDNVKIGTYYAVVKDSKLVEVTTTAIIVKQPDFITFTTIQEPVKCLGDSNGTISIKAAGGNGNFKYRYFSNGILIEDWKDFSNGSQTVLTGLADGEYLIQVQDTQQCKSTDATVKITSPTALIISSSVAIPATGKGLSNGSLTVTAQGSNSNYTYQWFNSNGMVINQTTATATNLAAGKYYVVIKDAKGCNITSELLEVTEPPLLETTISVQNVILCNGDKNGSLKPTTIGGLVKAGENYTYQWFESGSNTLLATTTILNNIGKGSYYAIATDSNGNKATSQVLNLTEPEVLQNTLTSDYVLCGDFNDWSINTAPTGGTLPYNYSWNTGAKTSSIQNVPPGNYSVVITDSHGCSVTKSTIIVAPAHLDVQEVIKIPTCYQGSDATISLTTIAGTAPFKYLWNTGEKSNILKNAVAGNYSVDITDARGCLISRQYEIINPPKDIINLGEDVTLCYKQSLTINAKIDDDKATYLWTSDKGFKSTNPIITVSQPANYTVVVTNKLGCEATDTIMISSQESDISAEFAMSSQVFVNEKFIIVDISNPKADKIEWKLPKEAVITTDNGDYAEISFTKAGEYDISLNTQKGRCTAYQTKTILVTEGEYENPDTTDLQKKFDLKIYPNPSNGIFTVDAILDKIMPANIKVYNLSNNVVIDSKSGTGKDAYSFNFNLSGLPSGIYFVLFESQQGTKLRKIIIQ